MTIATPDRAAPPYRSNFFVAFKVLPPERRRAIEAVYGFCRRADDAVDDATNPALARAVLERLGREIEDVFSGRPGNADTESLSQVVQAFRLPRLPFDRLLEGVSWDLEGRRYATVQELREYCRRVASSVGLLCIRIFGCEAPSCDRYAEELGVALQWTNILRDVSQDLARGRVYVPAESFARHGLAPEDLSRRDPDLRARLDRLIRSEVAYARGCFVAAERALPPVERPRVLAGRIMAAVYQALLRKIERAGSHVLDRRVALSGAYRGALAMGVVLRDRLRLA